jgi:hypothetical protein
MDAKLQDDELVKAHLKNHDRLASLRAPWESVWQEIDERVNPLGAGGFQATSMARTSAAAGTVKVRGQSNFDVTAVESLDRFTAAMAGICIPRNTQYIRLKFADRDLDKLPAVRRWCEAAADRLHAIRYAPHAGFEVQAQEDFRQLGSYGTGAFWTGERKGLGLFYRALHLSECYIDEDFAGRIDTVHRRYRRTARQCEQEFGRPALTPKMREALDKQKLDDEFELLHIVCPNGDLQPDAMDRRAMPIDSVTIAVDEKAILRRSGFHSMPISVSRHVTGPADIYGRSPALKVLPTIKGVNTMAQTNLRAGHKMVDPALAFFDDDGITSLVTRPGGANAGLVNDRGQLLVQALPSASNLPVGLEMVEAERAVIRTAFLEDFFRILTNPADRMTATQVLEMVAKQGVLVAPYAGRYETEKQNPVTQRDLARRGAGSRGLSPDRLREPAEPHGARRGGGGADPADRDAGADGERRPGRVRRDRRRQGGAGRRGRAGRAAELDPDARRDRRAAPRAQRPGGGRAGRGGAGDGGERVQGSGGGERPGGGGMSVLVAIAALAAVLLACADDADSDSSLP